VFKSLSEASLRRKARSTLCSSRLPVAITHLADSVGAKSVAIIEEPSNKCVVPPRLAGSLESVVDSQEDWAKSAPGAKPSEVAKLLPVPDVAPLPPKCSGEVDAEEPQAKSVFSKFLSPLETAFEKVTGFSHSDAPLRSEEAQTALVQSVAVSPSLATALCSDGSSLGPAKPPMLGSSERRGRPSSTTPSIASPQGVPTTADEKRGTWATLPEEPVGRLAVRQRGYKVVHRNGQFVKVSTDSADPSVTEGGEAALAHKESLGQDGKFVKVPVGSASQPDACCWRQPQPRTPVQSALRKPMSSGGRRRVSFSPAETEVKEFLKSESEHHRRDSSPSLTEQPQHSMQESQPHMMFQSLGNAEPSCGAGLLQRPPVTMASLAMQPTLASVSQAVGFWRPPMQGFGVPGSMFGHVPMSPLSSSASFPVYGYAIAAAPHPAYTGVAQAPTGASGPLGHYQQQQEARHTAYPETDPMPMTSPAMPDWCRTLFPEADVVASSATGVGDDVCLELNDFLPMCMRDVNRPASPVEGSPRLSLFMPSVPAARESSDIAMTPRLSHLVPGPTGAQPMSEVALTEETRLSVVELEPVQFGEQRSQAGATNRSHSEAPPKTPRLTAFTPLTSGSPPDGLWDAGLQMFEPAVAAAPPIYSVGRELEAFAVASVVQAEGTPRLSDFVPARPVGGGGADEGDRTVRTSPRAVRPMAAESEVSVDGVHAFKPSPRCCMGASSRPTSPPGGRVCFSAMPALAAELSSSALREPQRELAMPPSCDIPNVFGASLGAFSSCEDTDDLPHFIPLSHGGSNGMDSRASTADTPRLSQFLPDGASPAKSAWAVAIESSRPSHIAGAPASDLVEMLHMVPHEARLSAQRA